MSRTLDQLGDRPVLSAGIGAADPLALGRDLDHLANAGVRTIHVDMMDGIFCPLVTAAAPSLVRAASSRFAVDVHLMVDRPFGVVDVWVAAGAQMVTFHLEAARQHSLQLLERLQPNEIVRGVAILPDTPVAYLGPLLDDVELVLLVAVNPGRGEDFRSTTFDRIREARDMIADRAVALSIDGGVTAEIASRLAHEGVDVIVSGSAIFNGGDANLNARHMLDQIS